MITDIRNIDTYAARMIASILNMKHAMRDADGSEKELAILLAMWLDLTNEGSRIIEECTGKDRMLNGSYDSIKDDHDDAFYEAANDEEEAEEAANDATERSYSRADDAYSAMRDERAVR